MKTLLLKIVNLQMILIDPVFPESDCFMSQQIVIFNWQKLALILSIQIYEKKKDTYLIETGVLCCLWCL